jgi:hypothetical protein
MKRGKGEESYSSADQCDACVYARLPVSSPSRFFVSFIPKLTSTASRPRKTPLRRMLLVQGTRSHHSETFLFTPCLNLLLISSLSLSTPGPFPALHRRAVPGLRPSCFTRPCLRRRGMLSATLSGRSARKKCSSAKRVCRESSRSCSA